MLFEAARALTIAREQQAKSQELLGSSWARRSPQPQLVGIIELPLRLVINCWMEDLRDSWPRCSPKVILGLSGFPVES
jgi:hypothetical protein